MMTRKPLLPGDSEIDQVVISTFFTFFDEIFSCIKYFNFSVHQRKVTGMAIHPYQTTKHASQNGKRKI